MHVNQTLRSRALVEIIDILGTKKEAIAELRFQVRQCDVRWIRLCVYALLASFGVKLPD